MMISNVIVLLALQLKDALHEKEKIFRYKIYATFINLGPIYSSFVGMLIRPTSLILGRNIFAHPSEASKAH